MSVKFAPRYTALLVASLFATAPMLAHAQTSTETASTASAAAIGSVVLSDIRINGLQRSDPASVLNIIPVKVGQRFNADKGTDVVKALYASGLYDDVSVGLDGTVLTVKVVERPTIADLTISGMKQFEKKAVLATLKQNGFAQGYAYNPELLERVKAELQGMYAEAGLVNVEITSDVAKEDRNQVAVALKIVEGKFTKVKHITINGTGLLQVRSTAHASETMLARIIEAVERAQSSRAPVQAFVDRFAAIYTPAMFALSCSVALGGTLLLGWPWLDAIYKALVVLVISCPCALVMSTPVTIVSALASAARRGILIKGGRYLEQARALKTIAFDKTGTLTIGKPQLVDVLLQKQENQQNQQAHALPTALVLAAQSDHPVSLAIAQGLQQQDIAPLPESSLQAITAVPGRGMQAQLADGTTLLLGHERWLQEQGIATDALSAHISAQQALGHTVTLLAIGQEAVAVFAVADTVKDHAQEALADLHALGITTAMLSGDHSATATAVAKQLGITQVHGELLPEHKLDAITSHQRQGATGMVGDGINDAPALAQADIGFAMGAGGTHIAVEAADIVIMGDDLRRIPETIRLSRQAYAVLWQNIGMALGFKAIFFATAITGHATMWMAVFADIGTTLIVIANSLRMLRWRK